MEGGVGGRRWTAAAVARINKFKEQRGRHVLTPAFAQHAAVHYSTGLSAPTAESSRRCKQEGARAS